MSWVGDHVAALGMLGPLVAHLRHCGALGMLPFALAVTAHAEALAGRLGAARSSAAEAEDLARAAGNEYWHYLALSALAHVLAIRGDGSQCRARAAEAMALQHGGNDYPRDASEALGLLELGLGRYPEAIAAFQAGVRAAPGAAVPDPSEGHPDLVEAYIRDRRAPTDEMRVMLEQLTAQTRIPLHAAIAWRLRALVADDAGFADMFDAALRYHAEVDCPFETARTLLAYGERLRRGGQRVRARTRLREAREIFERLPARTWALRARDELAATGEAARDRLATSALDDLTPQEYQVARLIVTGSSNREAASALFLSPKTIEYHLGNVYRKLGVRGRTELTHRYHDLPVR